MKLNTGSIIIIVVAAALGLFLGNGLGGAFGTDPGSGWFWALVVGVVSAAGAYFAVVNYSRAVETGDVKPGTQIEDSKFAKFLFSDTRAAAIWLPIRLFIGVDFLSAGWHKFQDAAWMDNGSALLGFWKSAVAINAQTGKGAITYDWWRNFLQGMIDSNANVWFAKVITFGEMLVGLGLIFGALVGVAAFFGAVMNLSFLLSGAVSVNPVFLTLSFGLILAWKVAGWFGLDRYLLPALGTPWKAGALFKHDRSPQTVP